jgi:hypothetical protein
MTTGREKHVAPGGALSAISPAVVEGGFPKIRTVRSRDIFAVAGSATREMISNDQAYAKGETSNAV